MPVPIRQLQPQRLGKVSPYVIQVRATYNSFLHCLSDADWCMQSERGSISYTIYPSRSALLAQDLTT